MIDQFIGIGSGTTRTTRAGHVSSLAMGFAKALLKFVVARNYFPLEDLLMGKVDYDQFSEKVSDLIRKSEDDQMGIYGLMNNFEKVQDFLEQVSGGKAETNPNAKKNEKKKRFNEKCPECGGTLMHVEGCLKCTCGFSRC